MVRDRITGRWLSHRVADQRAGRCVRLTAVGTMSSQYATGMPPSAVATPQVPGRIAAAPVVPIGVLDWRAPCPNVPVARMIARSG